MESGPDAGTSSSALIVGPAGKTNEVSSSTIATTAKAKTKPKAKGTNTGKGRHIQRQYTPQPSTKATTESVLAEMVLPLTPPSSSSIEAVEDDSVNRKELPPPANETVVAGPTSASMTTSKTCNINHHRQTNNNNANNNNNTLCTINSMDKADHDVDQTSGDVKNYNESSANEKKEVQQQMSVDSNGDEVAISALPDGSDSTMGLQEDEEDEDNWENLIDSGTLDKSLEKLRVKDKGTTRLNDANSEYQKQHQKNEKTRTPSGPTKINVRLEEPSRTTPPTIKILRRETAPTGVVSIAPGTANGERGSFAGDTFTSTHRRSGDSHRSGEHNNSVPTPPTGKTYAQRQEEYARARMRILGPGNGNNLPVSVPSNNQQRNHNSPQAMQRAMPGTIGRGFGLDMTGTASGRRGSHTTGAHRRGGHTSVAPPSGYYGNNSVQQQHQHHQNNNAYSGSSSYYNGNRNNAASHGNSGQHSNSSNTHSSNGGSQGMGAGQHTPPTMHRANGGYMR
ncbi:uncharacterized protein DDB_G0283357-like [Varroa destructor]|uniref:SUZ domain-containing protein n=1 Tax=Varroa destructor TaxID=109461 RepID=A0A7M7KS03_VARDE|nr:uncharacterized protein DDB_G0283357-like [Varroa destructor]